MNYAKTITGLFILSSGAFAIWYASKRRISTGRVFGGEMVENALEQAPNQSRGENVFQTNAEFRMKWITPAKGRIYDADFKTASDMYGLPDGLLSRVAYQESRYNPLAKSPVGAIGLMQFMPKTAKEFNLNPLDPIASIYAGAKYLKQLYNKFGNWKEAVAAYNWGQGNVARKGLSKAPLETRNYFAQILSDIGLA